MRGKITVVEYDPSWPTTFATLKSRALAALGAIAVSIEHVGSTSVPGLAAKPIIDIDVIVPSTTDVANVIKRLETIGYQHQGNLGIDGREAFHSPPNLPEHHLYVCVQGAVALANHLAVRDYLRRNATAARAYSALKMRLAQSFPTDIDRYVDGKTDFLLGVLRECGFTDDALSGISDANRIDPSPHPVR